MAKIVLVFGESGSGKSSSLENFDKEEISIFNVTNKDLPFRKKLPKIDNATYEDIATHLSNPNKKCYVIDDCGYLMGFSSLRRASEKGYDKWNEIAGGFFNMVDFIINDIPDDIIVYLFMHEEVDKVTGKIKCKTAGQMIDNQIFLEGMFTIVIRCRHGEDGYKFIVQSEVGSTVKTPKGMFDSPTIDNDLKAVDTVIRKYYEMPPLKPQAKSMNTKPTTNKDNK